MGRNFLVQHLLKGSSGASKVCPREDSGRARLAGGGVHAVFTTSGSGAGRAVAGSQWQHVPLRTRSGPRSGCAWPPSRLGAGVPAAPGGPASGGVVLFVSPETEALEAPALCAVPTSSLPRVCCGPRSCLDRVAGFLIAAL